MGKKDHKLSKAAHIKKNTKGTSNELSFSVLDAAKIALDDQKDGSGLSESWLGKIPLFTLPVGKKKPSSTPTKPSGLHLSTGDFVSTEDETSKRSLTFDLSAPGRDERGRVKENNEQQKKQTVNQSSHVKVKHGPPATPKPVRTAEEEIMRRKAYRMLSKVAAASLASLMLVGIVVSGATYIYGEYQSYVNNVNQLDTSIGLVQEADEAIAELDMIIENPFDQDFNDYSEQISEELLVAQEALAEADALARIASTDLNEATAKEAANQVVITIAYREEIIDYGSQMLVLIQEAQDAAESLDSVWAEILSADELIREAAALVTETTNDNVSDSIEINTEAKEVLNTVYALLQEQQELYPYCDYTTLLEYVDKRIEAIGYAIASDEAFLDRDTDEASKQNEKYNEADTEATSLANSIPSDVSSLIYEGYEENSSQTLASYEAARLDTEATDAFIRDYLGTS